MFACLALALSACGPASASPTPTPAPTSAAAATLTPFPRSTLSDVTPGADSQPAVDAALVDAASHLGVPRDQLRLESVQPQQWPDSSLGCPQPGEMYSQIVTPGFLIVITSGASRLEYHTDAHPNVTVKLCRQS